MDLLPPGKLCPPYSRAAALYGRHDHFGQFAGGLDSIRNQSLAVIPVRLTHCERAVGEVFKIVEKGFPWWYTLHFRDLNRPR